MIPGKDDNRHELLLHHHYFLFVGDVARRTRSASEVPNLSGLVCNGDVVQVNTVFFSHA